MSSIPKILIRHGSTAAPFDLPQGVTRIGRREENDLAIDDPSVSGVHCEMLFDGQTLFVRDLGSTNGTFIDGAPISEGALRPGQVLHLGSVELRLEIPRAPGDPSIPIPVAVPNVVVAPGPPPVMAEVRKVCHHHTQTAAQFECTRCEKIFCDLCVKDLGRVGSRSVQFCPDCKGRCEPIGWRARHRRTEAPFLSVLFEAFKYPFRKEGYILLIGGTVFLMFMRMLTGFGGGFILLGMVILLSIGTSGYLFSYMQRIIVTSAQGEEILPTWPEFSDFYQDMIAPFLLIAGTLATCFGPALLFLFWSSSSESEAWRLMFLSLVFLGLVWFPMCLLAVSIADSFSGLNPVLIAGSILRIPGDYAVACVAVLLLGAAGVLLKIAAGFVPIFGGFLAASSSLYFLIVQMRLLGLMYYSNRTKLSWI